MVHGLFKSKKGLAFNFNPTAKLEVEIRKSIWCEVSSEIFRSWGGARRINGKLFVDDVFYLQTNNIAATDKQLQTV